MATKETKLRFAALTRVSTERQEEEGESLRSQRLQLEHDVNDLGGTITAWYGGQEHATPGHEKKEVNRLLEDAQKQPKRFDAVIVANHFRWSRDNTASKAGLEVFRQNDIKFYVGTNEHDLWDPVIIYILAQFAEVGEFFARSQSNESHRKRADRAKRGVPTAGRLPYGRKFIRSADRQTGHWEIIEEDKRKIQECAKRYVAGESIFDLAKEHGISRAHLRTVLTKTAGSQWRIRFKSKVPNRPDEVVTMEVPPLLDEKTIAAIHARSASNKTFTHKPLKNRYLLARMIGCAHCGHAMTGQPTPSGRYYVHLHKTVIGPCPGPEKKSWPRANEIEENVMLLLFDTFGNPVAVQKAIEEATPNNEKVQEAMKRKERLNEELVKLEASRQRILDLVVKDMISDDSRDTQLKKLKEREKKLTEERNRLTDELAHLPSRERIQTVSKMIAGQFRTYTDAKAVAKARHANRAFDEMTYQEKRQLCEMVFSGKTADGRRMGVWVTWSADGKKWRYELEGHLIEKGTGGPVKPGLFTFGAPHAQKALVTKACLHRQ